MGNVLLIFESNLARELIDLIDTRLSKLAVDSTETEIPDELGYFDSMEHLTGLGFVTCQTYITAVYGILKIDKKKALSKGAHHSSGSTIPVIVNAAANYWKHNNEWELDKTDKQRKIIEKTFESIGFPVNLDYPLSGVLTEISEHNYVSFMSVFRKLEVWKNELQNA